MQKKLLILGVDTSTRTALRIARELGLYTIVTDYNTPEEKPEKAQADEFWMINVADTEALYKKCLKEHVDGIFAGNHEFCLDQVKVLCKRLGLPFYASDEGWHCARDKVYFKELCAKCGLDTPKTYMTHGSLADIDISEIAFPVIVKPSDSCAGRGITICESADQLPGAFEYALGASQNKQIIIEEYVVGDELTAEIMVVDHKPYMTGLCGTLPGKAFSLAGSRYHDDYVKHCMGGIEKLMQLLDWKTGPCFLQCIARDGRYYFMEFGGRLSGIGTWSYYEYFFHMSKLRMAVMLAMGMPMDANDAKRICSAVHNSLIYLPRLKAGKIAEIAGLDDIKGMPGVEVVLERYKIGDEPDTSGSMLEIAYYIAVAASDVDGLCDKLKTINDTLSVKSTDGREMLIKNEDYEGIRRQYE